MTVYFYQHEHSLGAVGEIQLARPEACNAVNEYMSQRLYYGLEQWLQQPNIVLIIIRGLGNNFCAGADLATLLLQKQITPGSKDDFLLRQYQIIKMLRQAKTPVLALAHGAICGFGAGVFMAARHRVIATDVAFSMPECAIGFIPDVGATKFLHQFPQVNIDQMLNLGQALSGLQLEQAGVIDQVINMNEFTDYVSGLVSNCGNLTFCKTHRASPKVILTKRSAAPTARAYAENLMAITEQMSYGRLLSYEYAIARHLLMTEDFSEGINAFLAKRPAVWQGLSCPVDLEMLRSMYGFFD